jgi:beta-catenin-like protein 1
VEDDPEEDDDAVAGPEMPPELEDAENDEEGRFFGGGINADTAEVLDFIDERDQEITAKPEKIDSAWVRKLALNFERRITRNAELRAKYEGDPQKFMGSEADLDADIKALSILTENTELYKDFAELGCVASLVSLLSHENTDIAIDAIEIIGELIDEDVEAEQSQWDALVDAMLEADVLDLLYQNISRLDENVESDRNGVYHILGVFDDLTSRPSIADLIGGHPSIIPYLLSRAQKPEKPVSQNKQYAAEVLAILLQISASNCDRFLEQDGMDKFLQLLAAYRKRDPEKGTDEEEYVENVFDCVTCCLDKPLGKEKFLDAEGVELCLIMLREGKFCRSRALRLLDHALDGLEGGACSEKLVEAAGLKVLFTLFMKKQDHSSTEHILDILAHMLRSLPADSAPRIRLLGKFVEKNYEKIDRLLQLRREYSSRLASTDAEIADEKNGLEADELEERAEEWASRRLEGGLFSLQVTDTILAWLVAEDDGAKRHIRQGLAERDEGLESIKGTLQEQVEGMDGEAGGMRDMLETLMAFL